MELSIFDPVLVSSPGGLEEKAAVMRPGGPSDGGVESAKSALMAL
jgi:hypothetical protein